MGSISVTKADVLQAQSRIQSSIRITPLIRSELLEREAKAQFPIYLKLESLQRTGSFKVRGALNKLLQIQKEAQKVGIITASAGNHAQGVAYFAHQLRIPAKIVMPVSSPLIKLSSTRQWGAEVVQLGDSYQDSYDHAVRIGKEEGRIYVHAFDDPAIVAGQGTVALECLNQAPDMKVLLAPIGGGGLMAGCAVALEGSGVKLVAVQAEGCSTFLPSLQEGKPITLTHASTIAEGMSAKRMGDLTFEVCKKYVNQTLTVTDEEIAQGLLWALEKEHIFVEGCGGASLAAVFKDPFWITGPTVVILSGGNLDVNFLARIIERGLRRSGRLTQIEAIIDDVPGSLERLVHIFAAERASIVQIDHERVFGESRIREVFTSTVVETSGPEHQERLREALKASGHRARFLP